MTCTTGKRCYPGRRSARRANVWASWRIRVYICPECGRFHVTNHEKG